jgi:hypothetical protein
MLCHQILQGIQGDPIRDQRQPFQPSSLPALTRKVVSLRADLPEGRPKLAHDLSEHDAIDTTMGPNRHSVVKPDGDGT